MAINANINPMLSAIGRGSALGSPVGGGERTPPAAPSAPVAPSAPAAPRAPTAPPSAPPFMATISPGIAATLPGLIGPRIPDLIRPLPLPVFFPEKTTTQIAQGAIGLLNGASQAVLQEAVNTVKNRNIAASNLMNYLERKVKIGEVLSELAARWSEDTKQDFAEAFQMPKDKLEVMDAIVSISVLNDPDLDEELMVENMSEATDADLLENRRIVWQYPPPGTVLQPPFLILLAVEHRDTKRAEELIQSTIGGLVDYQGYKLPRAAAQKLTGRPAVTAVSPAVTAISPALNLGSALRLNR